jgi:hypothetical protein
LKYNATNSLWEAGQIAIGNLSNVFYTTPNNNDILQYKTSGVAGSNWYVQSLNIPTILNDLTDVSIVSPVLD